MLFLPNWGIVSCLGFNSIKQSHIDILFCSLTGFSYILFSLFSSFQNKGICFSFLSFFFSSYQIERVDYVKSLGIWPCRRSSSRSTKLKTSVLKTRLGVRPLLLSRLILTRSRHQFSVSPIERLTSLRELPKNMNLELKSAIS